MQISVTPGHSYAITTTTACTVSAVDGQGGLYPILTIPAPGQHIIIAPSTLLDVGDDHALVTPARKHAAASRGNHPFSLHPTYRNLMQFTFQGTLDQPAHGFGSEIKTESYLSSVNLNTGNAAPLDTRELWLKAWLILENKSIWLGTSQAGAIPRSAATLSWDFPLIHLPLDGTVLFTFHTADSRFSTHWGQSSRIILRAAPAPPRPTVCVIDGQGWPPALIPIQPKHQLMLKNISGFDVAGVPLAIMDDISAHTGDTSLHIEMWDRAAWDGKADGEELTAHRDDQTAHLTPAEHASLKDLLDNRAALLALLTPARDQPA